MNSKINPAEYDRLMAAAKLQAQQLRRQASEEFWSGTGRAAVRVLQAARRRAWRLLRRIAPEHRHEA